MLLLLAVATITVIAVLTARRPVAAVAAVLVVTTALPYGVAQPVFGSSWHPATLLTLAVVVVQVIARPGLVATTAARMTGTLSALGGFLAIAFATSYLTGRTGSIGTLVLQVVAPLALLVVIRAAVARDPRTGGRLARVLVAVGVAQALVVIGVFTGLVPQPWRTFVESSRWWAVDPTRMVGTLEHPLVAALWMTAAVPFVASLRRVWLQCAVVLVLLAAVALTGSRLSLVIAAVSAVVVLFRSDAHLFVKVVSVASVFAGGAALLLGSAGATVSERFADDGGSGSVRAEVLDLFGMVWQQTVVVGRGFGASEEVTRNALIGATFENPVLMYTVDFGGIATLLFFGALVVIAVGKPGATRLPGGRLAAVGVLVAVLGFNSLSTNAAVGPLLFVVLALAAPVLAAPVRRPAGRVPAVHHLHHHILRAERIA